MGKNVILILKLRNQIKPTKKIEKNRTYSCNCLRDKISVER